MYIINIVYLTYFAVDFFIYIFILLLTSVDFCRTILLAQGQANTGKFASSTQNHSMLASFPLM